MLVDYFIITILAILGIFLIIAEVFLIPGFGIAGISGMLFLIGTVWFAFSQLGPEVGYITLVVCGCALIIGIVLFVKSKLLTHMALKKEIKSTSPNIISQSVSVGTEAKTISILNPMGSVLVNGSKMEAKSLDGFIEEDSHVIVTKVEPTLVIVKKI